MKVIHTIAGFDAQSGGTSTCTYDLLAALNALGCAADVVSIMPASTHVQRMGNGEEWIKWVDNDCLSPLAYSINIKQFLKDENEYNMYHTNGLWMYTNHITCAVARAKNKPYVITPHGMLYPQALARSAWKKKLMTVLCFHHDIEQAACIHVTCVEEMKHYRNLGYTNPVAVIANPVPRSSFADEIIAESRKHANDNRLRIGFLGRLHPRKQVECLLDGVAKLPISIRERVDVYVMGSGDANYERFLRERVQCLSLKNVHFTGFITGREKYEKLASLTALCVPSDMENFGMIVTEALSMGTPVIASLGTPWQVLNKEHCGWWVDNSAESIAATLTKINGLSGSELNAMGERGRQLVERDFSDIQVALKMKQLYEWILNKGKRPEFVYLCN